MRQRMTIDLSGPLRAHAPDAEARPVLEQDAPALAALMLSAYRGTVDDEGEGPEGAAHEVQRVLAGVYGPFDFQASEVVLRAGMVVACTLVTHYQGVPLIAFSLTDPAWQRRGLARAGLLRALARLQGAGQTRADLAVTIANTPARTLYESLGFLVVAGA